MKTKCLGSMKVIMWFLTSAPPAGAIDLSRLKPPLRPGAKSAFCGPGLGGQSYQS